MEPGQKAVFVVVLASQTQRKKCEIICKAECSQKSLEQGHYYSPWSQTLLILDRGF